MNTWYCECNDLRCERRIQATDDEYIALRAAGGWIRSLDCAWLDSDEYEVERNPRYWVAAVRKDEQ
jgi:hypothetical protein